MRGRETLCDLCEPPIVPYVVKTKKGQSPKSTPQTA